MSRFLKRLKNSTLEILQSRITIIVLLFFVLMFVLVKQVFYLQIVKGKEYAEDYKLQILRTKEVTGTRGNIYDRNGNLLAYNELAYSVTIEDNGTYDSMTQKNEILNQVITDVISIVEKHGDSVINSFGIILDKDQNYKFVATNETNRLRFVADVFGKQTIDQLTDEQSHMSAADIIDYLCTDEIIGYDLDQADLSKEEILKLVNVRYAMSLNSYQKYIPTVISEDVCTETVAEIEEHLDSFQGINVIEDSLRKYNDPECFANIIGYIGQISQEEYDSLSKADKKKYSLTDHVGKSGIEQTMDSYLQGTKGEVKLYVNSVGKVIETINETPSAAGNDVYLSIDADLQKAAYHIIEQKLAGIILTNMTPSLDFDRTSVDDGSKVKIAIGDVYYSFIDNDIIDITRMGDKEVAQETEIQVNDTFTKEKKSILSDIEETLQDPDAPAYMKLSKEFQAYLNYIITTKLTANDQILMSSAIDTSDEVYIAWENDESINVYSYLTYAISQNWVNTALLTDYLPEKEQYSNSSETYEALIKYVVKSLEDDDAFDKLIYKYMIKSGKISGKQICLILFEQEFLEEDSSAYKNLKRGSTTAYDFIRSKINSLEITAGDLALEPCTGSLVMLDQDTGDVLACVSYPGYDNNRLANSMDSDYYSSLISNNARPFYNNATQEKTAPGSTYKPLSSIAALTEGVIDTSTYVGCSGEFKKVTPPPQCWIYPNSHGSLNVEGAIKNSCNVFFYEVGWQLGQVVTTDDEGKKDSTYYSEVGLKKLKRYASAFGFDENTGVEIPESEPEISDDSAILSAIGQGSNNYTTTQIARYANGLATQGTVYNLSLLQKVTDIEGKVIETYGSTVRNQIENVDQSSWDAVYNGMSSVISSSYADVFARVLSSDVQLYGKTGTAQQSQTHPDHALFIGFTKNTKNDVAFAVRIANGYGSTYAAQIGKDAILYYYDLEPKEEILTGEATVYSAPVTNQD